MEKLLRERLKVALNEIDLQLSGGYYRFKPYQAPIVDTPDNIYFFEHEVQNEYFEYLEDMKRRKKLTKKSEVQTEEKPHPKFPYGRVDFIKSFDEKTKTGKKKALPIVGPPNFGQLWPTAASMGQEYREETYNYPLIEAHLAYLRSLDEALPRELLTHIAFGDKLGSGGFGEVWRVTAQKYDSDTNESTEVILACKVLRISPKIASQGLYGKVFQKSLESHHNFNILGDMLALRQLKHDNICDLIHVIPIPDTETGFPFAAYCLFMNLCDGDLERLVQRYRRLSEAQTKNWFKQIADALNYLHGQHVVHQDIKLGNIFLMNTKPNPTFKLGDFGLAICYAPGTLLGVVSGPTETRRGGYVQVQSMEETKANDILCLGRVLLESILGVDVAGSFPFLNIRPSFSRSYGVNAVLTDLITRMRYEEPLSRITIEKVLSHQWLTN